MLQFPLLSGEKEKLIHADTLIAKRIIGQQNAIEAIANAVRRSRAGLQDPNKPLGSFLFLGPTGVGKTELARTLSEFLFNTERAMIRLEMKLKRPTPMYSMYFCKFLTIVA